MSERSHGLPTIEQISDVTSRILGNNIDSVTAINSGLDSNTFAISCDTGERNQNYDVEHQILRIGKDRGLKVPTPIASDVDLTGSPFAFSLLERVQGVGLNQIDQQYWPSILEEVGQQLSSLYGVKMEGYGEIDKNEFRATGKMIGKSSSWIGSIVEVFELKIKALEAKITEERTEGFKDSNLTSVQIGKIVTVLDNIPRVRERILQIENGEQSVGSLIHADIHFEHILVNNGRLAGIIDFNKTLVGDPLFDIAYYSVMPNGEYYPHIKRTANVEWEEDRFHLYRLLMSIRKIHTRYVAYNHLAQQPKVLDIAIEEINRLRKN